MSGPQSLYEGFVDFDTSQMGDDDPVDTALWLSAVNNSLHFADQASQVRVAIPECTLTSPTLGATTEWGRIGMFGPWDHRLDQDGVPYPVRFRIAGSATNTSTTYLTLIVSAASVAERVLRSGAYDGATNAARVSTASTSAAWLTPAGGASTLMTFVAADAADALGTTSTIAVGGSSAGVETCSFVATVWGRSVGSVGVQAQLRGLYIAEYCGPVV